MDFPGLAYIPVLAELAGQVAACRAKRQHRRAGQEMIQRFLIDGVNAVAAGTAIGGEHDLVIQVFPDKTQTALACV